MRVKPSTTYTYSCATVGDRFGVAGENSVVDPSVYTTSNKLTFDSVLVPLKSSSIKKTYSFTTGANTQMVAVYCALNTVPTDIQIEEGETATAYEAYTEIPYQPEVLMVGGANLFNASSYTEINAYVNANTGVLTTGSPGSMTQYCAVIPCKSNTTYNIAGQGTSAWGSFTSDAIGTTATAFGKGGILTTGANDRYLIRLITGTLFPCRKRRP